MTDDSRFGPADGPPVELDWGARAPRGADGPPEVEEAAAPVASMPSDIRRRGAGPGDPADMSPPLRLQLDALFTGSRLQVRQFREPLEMLVGWSQANRYEVSDEGGRPVFWAGEAETGALAALSRNFNPFHRNTTECLTPDGTLAMKVTFPFTFIFRRGDVTAWDGRPLGSTQQRFNLLRLRVDVVGTTGATLLEIAGPALKFFSFSDWVFEVRQRGQVVARIRKHWAGWFQETFSRADNFSIEFEPGFTDPRLRQLAVAAALTIDLMGFEQKDSHRLSASNLLQRLLG
ncbi:MAG: scramblase [Archangium sp.]|nr:scramblase [Archangium sp.]